MKQWQAGAISGLAEVTFTHPIDNIKTRFQQASLSKTGITGLMGGLRFREYYTGYLPRMAGVVPMRMVFWGSMHINNKLLSPVLLPQEIKGLLAGGITGFLQAIIDAPIESAKVRLITGGQQIKLKHLTRGFKQTCVRNMLFTSILNTYIVSNQEDGRFLTGATGGIIASVLTQPFDALKTQAQRLGGGNVTLRDLSIRQMFSGLVPRAVLSFSTMGIGYVVFSLLVNDDGIIR